jgi:prophage regulatory protein
MKIPIENISPYPIPDRILRQAEVEAKVGFKKTKIWEEVAKKRFPPPIALGPRAVGWRESEIDAWIAALPRAPRVDAGLEKARAARQYQRNQAQAA